MSARYNGASTKLWRKTSGLPQQNLAIFSTSGGFVAENKISAAAATATKQVRRGQYFLFYCGIA
jgi:hypothetical protein